MTFWFLWTSPTFFHCPRLHPVITVRSESPPLRPQSLQLSNLTVLLIQLPKQRHRVTEQPIPRKTQPRMARNHLTHASTRWLKFLPHKHALHASPRASRTRTHGFHAPPRTYSVSRTATLALGWHHIATSAHISRWQLTVDFDQTVDCWLWPKSKFFNRTYLAQFFT